MDEKAMEAKAAKEINRLRTEFRRTCHRQLNDYLDQEDNETGLPMLNTFLAYMGQGWTVAVGLSLTAP